MNIKTRLNNLEKIIKPSIPEEEVELDFSQVLSPEEMDFLKYR